MLSKPKNPHSTLIEQIAVDIPRTFPRNVYFAEESSTDEKKQSLFNVLLAFSNSSTSIGYCQVGSLYFLRLANYISISSIVCWICWSSWEIVKFSNNKKTRRLSGHHFFMQDTIFPPNRQQQIVMLSHKAQPAIGNPQLQTRYWKKGEAIDKILKRKEAIFAGRRLLYQTKPHIT